MNFLVEIGGRLATRRLGREPVDRLDLQTGKHPPWKQFMPSDPAGVENIGPILLTPDAKNCVYGYHRMLADLYLVEGLK